MTALIPPTPPDLMTLGKVFATSGYFADARDQAQAVVKILAGQELGIGPVASMTGIYVVKGRVTISANLIGAQIKRSGKYDYRIVELTHEVCKLDFFEKGERVGDSSFTLEDAQTAGLGGGENYRKFSRNMLFARAISNGAKWFCPDIFSGPVYTPDELGAAIDPETGDVLSLPPAEDAAPKEKKLDSFVKARQRREPEAPASTATIERTPEDIEHTRSFLTREEERLAREAEDDSPPPRVEPEREQREIRVVEPEPLSETSLALKRSILLKQRDKLGLSNTEFDALCRKVSSRPFAKWVGSYDMDRLGNLLAGMLGAKMRASRRGPEGGAA